MASLIQGLPADITVIDDTLTADKAAALSERDGAIYQVPLDFERNVSGVIIPIPYQNNEKLRVSSRFKQRRSRAPQL